jgi:hypothetical protein
MQERFLPSGRVQYFPMCEHRFSDLSQLAQALRSPPYPAHPWAEDGQSASTQCCGTTSYDPTRSSHHPKTSGVRVGGAIHAFPCVRPGDMGNRTYLRHR